MLYSLATACISMALAPICYVTDALNQDCTSEVQRTVSAAIAQIVESIEQPYGAAEARKALMEGLPAQCVVEAIADRLENSGDFVDERLRRFAFHVLNIRYAAAYERGYEVLLAGLGDPIGVEFSVRALAHAPKSKHGQAAEKLQALLVENRPSNATVEEILRTLARFGQAAQVASANVESIFLDANRNEGVRGEAARGVVNIAGLARALEALSRSDAVGRRVMMGALARYFEDAAVNREALRPEALEYRPKAFEYVLKEMASQDVETRRVALAVLFRVGGFEHYVTIRSRSDYELSPKVKSVLTTMAANDPDAQLREKAAQALDPKTVDLIVAKALRERERQRKDVDE